MEGKLKIGGHTFRIIQRDMGNEELGETDFNTGIISIHSKSIRSIKESSLLHEILHVMNPTMDSSEDGHRILESLSEQLYEVYGEHLSMFFDTLLGREN